MNQRISGLEKLYPISLQELTACIYYKLAVERGLRGCHPSSELEAHSPYLNSDPNFINYMCEITGKDMMNVLFEIEKKGIHHMLTDFTNEKKNVLNEEGKPKKSSRMNTNDDIYNGKHLILVILAYMI